MGETALGLAAGIGIGSAAVAGVLCFVSYQWGRNSERTRWFKLIAEQQQKAQEVTSEPLAAGDPLVDKL